MPDDFVNPGARKDHVSTWPPSENVAPEIYPDAVRLEPGATAQSDDINVTMVVISVIFSACLLAVIITFIQAFYHDYTNADQEAKAVQSPALIQARAAWNLQLAAPAGWTDSTKKAYRMPIDQAIDAEVALQNTPTSAPFAHGEKGSR